MVVQTLMSSSGRARLATIIREETTAIISNTKYSRNAEAKLKLLRSQQLARRARERRNECVLVDKGILYMPWYLVWDQEALRPL